MADCLKCGYEWKPRVGSPKRCAWCGQVKWWEPRRDGRVPEMHRGENREPGVVEVKHCKQCDRDWNYRGGPEPIRCGKCKSPYWDRDRRTEVVAIGKELPP